jgi:hypothetical protein
VDALLECKEFMACEIRVCESCSLEILGVFVSDDATGMSLQQKAERGLTSRSQSRSPSVTSPGLPKEVSSVAGYGKSTVPRLDLSPNTLGQRIAHAELGDKSVRFFKSALSHAIHEECFATQAIPVTGPLLNPFELQNRRERLLAALLQNEEDSKCARNECLDSSQF